MILEVVQSTYSHQEGVTVIASQPQDWYEGYDSILHFYTPADGTGLNIQVDVVKAYCEGSVGWTVDRVKLKLPNGEELPVRHTRIFHKENGAWKLVHNHVSVAVFEEG